MIPREMVCSTLMFTTEGRTRAYTLLKACCNSSSASVTFGSRVGTGVGVGLDVETSLVICPIPLLMGARILQLMMDRVSRRTITRKNMLCFLDVICRSPISSFLRDKNDQAHPRDALTGVFNSPVGTWTAGPGVPALYQRWQPKLEHPGFPGCSNTGRFISREVYVPKYDPGRAISF